MQDQNKFVGNSQSIAPPPPPHPPPLPPLLPLLCVAIFIILESQSENLWDQNYKLRPTKLQVTPTKLQVTSSKLTSLTAETNKFQLTNMLFITF